MAFKYLLSSMNKAIFPNPFRMDGLLFKGNTHTANSDGAFGALNAYQISSLYKASGYAFLFITDHKKFTDVESASKSFAREFLMIPEIELGIGESDVGTTYHLVGLI